MISKQKGFFFGIFASSVLVSSLLIISFVATVFRLGFVQPDPQNVSSNYDLIHTISGHLQNSSWETPGWSGKLSIGAIHDLLAEETKFFKNLTRLVYDSTLTGRSGERAEGQVTDWKNSKNMAILDTQFN
jgi:hypothetical protein